MNVKETFIFPYPRWHSLWHFPPCRVFVVTCREKMIAAPMGHYRFYISSFFRHMCSPFDMILLARYCCFCNFNGALIRLAGGNYWILHECIFDSIKWSRKGQKRAATKIKSWRAAKDAVIELGPTFSAMTMVSPSKSP